MTRTAHRSELGDFLKARRAEVSPALGGLAEVGRARRVTGLRREEVASLAHISTDYYTRIEQGRIQATAPVLDTIARALELDEDQRAYMFGLAGKADARNARPLARQQVSPQVRRLLGDLAATPAFVIGRRTDILAWNALAAVVFTDFGQVPEDQRTFVRLLFTDPAMRELYADWEEVARIVIAQLRMDSARYPDDSRLAALVGELSAQDMQFRQWWSEHDAASRQAGTKKLRHPIAGELILDWEAILCTTDPDQAIIIWTAEPGSPTRDALARLSAQAAPAPRRAPGGSSDRSLSHQPATY
jgi:transcriptional regulator with XRE-family HTH domain